MSLTQDEARAYFSANLVRVFEERGWTAQELARIVDVSPATVAQWALGEEFPCPRHFARVAMVTGKTREELLCPF